MSKCGILASGMPLEKLTRARIVQALNLLGELAEQEGVTLELCIYGGSALILAYGAREGTKDVDVMAKPWNEVERLAKRVAEELNLDEQWLGNGVRLFVSDQGTFAPLEIQELETVARKRLKITRPSASYLLAMKCFAGRPSLPGYQGDIEDIKFLIRKMGIRSVEEVERHFDRFYPFDALTPQIRETIEGILRETKSQL